jgi:archaellum component FlaC
MKNFCDSQAVTYPSIAPTPVVHGATEALERLHDEVKFMRSAVFNIHDRLIGNECLPVNPVEQKCPSKIVLHVVVEEAVDSIREVRMILEMLNDSLARQLPGVRIE